MYHTPTKIQRQEEIPPFFGLSNVKTTTPEFRRTSSNVCSSRCAESELLESILMEDVNMSTKKNPLLEAPLPLDEDSKPTSRPVEKEVVSHVETPSIHSRDFGALVDHVVEIEVDLRKQQELERLGRLAAQD